MHYIKKFQISRPWTFFASKISPPPKKKYHKNFFLPPSTPPKWKRKKLEKNVKAYNHIQEILKMGNPWKNTHQTTKNSQARWNLTFLLNKSFGITTTFADSISINCSGFFWLCLTLPPNMIATILILDNGHPYQARWDLSTTEWFAAVTKAKSSTYFHTRPWRKSVCSLFSSSQRLNILTFSWLADFLRMKR